MTDLVTPEVIVEAAVAPEASLAVEAPAPAAEAAWFDSLPEELKGNKSLTNFKSVEDLAKSYANQLSLLGKKVSDWTAEDVSKFHTKMGRPEKPEEYKFAEEMDAAAKADFAAKAFEAGLTQEQAKILADKLVVDSRLNKEIEAKAEIELKNKWVEELKSEFGDAYDKRINLARKTFNELADDGLKELVVATGLHEHPNMIKLFAKIGKEFLEPDRIVSSDSDTTFGISPAEAQNRINAKLADPDFKRAYLSATHPKHKDALAEITRLYQLM